METIQPRRHLPPELGHAIRAARTARGWSLRAAAEHTGISLSMLYRLEHGLRVPSIALAVRLAESLEMDPAAAEQLTAVAVPDRGRSRAVYALGARPTHGGGVFGWRGSTCRS